MIRSLLCALLFITSAQAVADNDPLAGLKKGQPKDVAALIERLVGCNHWSGEEPYDAERKREISAAMAELKCDRLAADESAALKRYAKNPSVLKALKDAKEMNY